MEKDEGHVQFTYAKLAPFTKVYKNAFGGSY